MSPQRTKVIVGGLLLVMAVAYLAYAGVRSGHVYCVDVDQFLLDAHYHDIRVRINGSVSPDGLAIHRGQMQVRFVLLGQGGRMPVAYTGIVPDMFKPGHEVFVEGRLDGDGVFQADTLLTKCASKYDAEDAHTLPPGHGDHAVHADQREQDHPAEPLS